MGVLTGILITALIFFACRRLVLIVAALLPRRSIAAADETLRVVVLVSCRDEVSQIDGLLDSLEALNYPDELLETILIDDASVDGTYKKLKRWADARDSVTCLSLERPAGKASALNCGLERAASSDVVVVYDADQRPRAESLRLLVQVFHDETVGAASGYRKPSNAAASMASRYGALECYAHQLIIQAGRDRLNWNPPTMGGNCAYRTSSLARMGGFQDGSFSEDTTASLALVADGQSTRFLVDVIADSEVCQSWHHYWRQRMRWTRGMYGASPHAGRRVESWMVVFGYLDRLVLTAALLLVIMGEMSIAWPAFYLTVPVLAVFVALAKADQLRVAPTYFISVLMLLPFEITVTVVATVQSLLRCPLRWRPRANRT